MNSRLGIKSNDQLSLFHIKESSSEMKRRPGSSEEHERVVEETLILLGQQAHQLGRFFRNETGVAYRDLENGKRVWIAYGIKGSPDIYGILIGGRYIGIEIKTGKAVQQENQKRFEAMIKAFGGYYFVARSAGEALEYVLRACARGE